MNCFHLNVEKLSRFAYNLALVKPHCASKAAVPMKIQDNALTLAV